MTFTTVDIKNVGEGQIISIPKDLKIDDEKVIIRKLGNALYLIPSNDPWRNTINSLSSFTEDFMKERSQPEWTQAKQKID